jgi:hypothetical protein
MTRAGQTPHGARPNRKEVRGFSRGHVLARCVKPSGRSLEPGSDAWPRGMAVAQHPCCGQNSAYRSGCLLSFSINNLLTSSRLGVQKWCPSCQAEIGHPDIVKLHRQAAAGSWRMSLRRGPGLRRIRLARNVDTAQKTSQVGGGHHRKQRNGFDRKAIGRRFVVSFTRAEVQPPHQTD